MLTIATQISNMQTPCHWCALLVSSGSVAPTQISMWTAREFLLETLSAPGQLTMHSCQIDTPSFSSGVP